jgi:hypothetical protein
MRALLHYWCGFRAHCEGGADKFSSVINSASFHTRVAVASRGRTVGVGVELSDVCLTLVCGGGLLGLLLHCCIVGVVSMLTV